TCVGSEADAAGAEASRPSGNVDPDRTRAPETGNAVMRSLAEGRACGPSTDSSALARLGFGPLDRPDAGRALYRPAPPLEPPGRRGAHRRGLPGGASAPRGRAGVGGPALRGTDRGGAPRCSAEGEGPGQPPARVRRPGPWPAGGCRGQLASRVRQEAAA